MLSNVNQCVHRFIVRVRSPSYKCTQEVAEKERAEESYEAIAVCFSTFLSKRAS